MGSKKPNVSKTNKVKLIISSKCAVYNGKNQGLSNSKKPVDY